MLQDVAQIVKNPAKSGTSGQPSLEPVSFSQSIILPHHPRV